MQAGNRTLTLIAVVLFIATGAARAGDVYVQTNLVSNIEGQAELTDPNLQGAWGLSFAAGGQHSEFWISNNASDTSTLYTVSPTTNTPGRRITCWRSGSRSGTTR